MIFLELDLRSHRILDGTDGIGSMISGNRGSIWIPHMYQALITLFINKISTKPYDDACRIYI